MESWPPNTLVTTEWLHDHLQAPDVRIVDASWYLPDQSRNPYEEYKASHIPSAQFFDIDEVCDHSSPYPHMLPSPEMFASRMRRMGLGDGNRVVAYDGAGLFSAARVWWMFRIMGHHDVAVLDGGYPKWLREGRPSEDLPPAERNRHFTARVNTTLLRTAEEIAARLDSADEQIIDARGPGRFTGAQPEPRPGVRSGHIPGSLNIHYRSLLDEDMTLLPPDRLRAVFDEAGVDLSKPIVTTCGSGVTAAILQLALAVVGVDNAAMYDGSWAEWGARDDLPVATG